MGALLCTSNRASIGFILSGTLFFSRPDSADDAMIRTSYAPADGSASVLQLSSNTSPAEVTSAGAQAA